MSGHRRWAKVNHFERAIAAKRNQLVEVLEEHDDMKEVCFSAEFSE